MAGPCAPAMFLVSKVARPTWANRTLHSHRFINGCITGGVGVPFLSGVVGNSVGVPSFSGIDVINITYNGMILGTQCFGCIYITGVGVPPFSGVGGKNSVGVPFFSVILINCCFK